MEKAQNEDLDQLLQSVGDPFQSSDPPLRDVQSVVEDGHGPMMTAVLLIEFASSGVWQNHLHHSNFASCEAILSMEEGKREALACVLSTTTYFWSEFLCTPGKITAAIRRLEELQCWNIVEVVIMWAWTVGVVCATDHDAWRLVGDDTVRFYQTHGMERLTTLSQHITGMTTEDTHLDFLLTHCRGPPCRVGRVKQTPPPDETADEFGLRYQCRGDLPIAQVCQLRRLYHLFGYDPMTWKEAVVVREAGEEMDISSGRSATPVQFVEWACDYP